MNRLLSHGFMLRSGPTRLVALLLAVLLVGSACSSGSSDTVDTEAQTGGEATLDADPSDSAPADGSAPAAAAADGADTGEAGDSELADLIDELPPAPIGFPSNEFELPEPTTLTIESLGIERAPVIDVGVELSGAMEVPPADQVGWYRHSPVPGQAGSSILAAHIAFDGENGVFVSLADVELGAVVEVTDDEGLTRSYVVESVDRYDKEALPEDIVFARSGPERLVLVTCGGRFDPELRSYDDNVVVVATPIDDAS